MKALRLDSEKQFSQQVCDLARILGWKVYRTWLSRFSPAGFPDLFMVRGQRVIAAELKMPGKWPTQTQLCWLRAFVDSGKVEVYVWWPEDLDKEIVGVLR